MAKVRRVIRKTQTAKDQGIENQFWPVVMALFVLGGFLLGVILVYLIDSAWFWPSLILLPVLIGSMIVALQFVNSRIVKRSMELALIISVIFHVVLIIVSVESYIFAKYGTLVPPLADKKPPNIAPVPEVVLQEQRIQQDHQQMAETATPDPEPEVVEKPEEKPQQVPEKPQQLPVPKPEKTVQPPVTKKQQVTETAPRKNEQQSKLTRQTTQAVPKSGTVAEVPEIKVETQKTEVRTEANPQKQNVADSQLRKRDLDQKPTTVTETPKIELTKKSTEATPTTDSQAPVLPRELAKNAPTPQTQVETVEQPTVPRKTDQQPTPNNVAANKQRTATPQLERTQADPTPTTTTDVTAKPVERQQPTVEQPRIASTPQQSPSERVRNTTRPSLPTPTEVIVPSSNPTPTPTQPSTVAETSSPTKATPNAPVVPRTTPDVAPAATPSTQVATNTPRTQSTDAPITPTTADSPTEVTRQTPNTTVNTNTAADVSTPSQTPSSADPSPVNPTSVAAAKQSANNNAAAQPVEAPAVANAAANPTATPTPVASRQPRAEAAPEVATSSTTSTEPRTSPTAAPSVSTTVNDAALAAAPTASNTPTPRASSATAARQTGPSSPTAERSQTSQEVATLSPTTQPSRSSANRADTSNAPSITPDASPANSPARTSRSAVAVASPTAAESPATQQSESGSGDPAAQPSRPAITKAQSGIAGVGKSENLDRTLPAASGAALAASDSAARPRATQTAEGPSFSPSQSADVKRAVTDVQPPGATITATADLAAARTGTDQPTDANASASASSLDARSNAAEGAVSASKGNVEVDLGPTKIVTNEETGRAAGGGQPTVNPETQADQVARADIGGAQLMALNTNTQADEIEAPVETGGGKPSPADSTPAAASLVQSEAGDTQPITGGPSKAAADGPAAAVSTSEQVAALSLPRAEVAEAAPGADAAGGGDPTEDEDEEEEERLRRLAREAAGGGPQLAMSALKVDVPSSAPGNPGGGTPAAETSTDTTEVAKASLGGGQPTLSGPTTNAQSGPPVTAGGGEVVAAVKMGRAESAQAQPGNPAVGGGTASPTKASTGPTFVAHTSAETFELASGGSLTGSPSAPAMDAQSLHATRLSGGATGPAVSGPVGAISGQPIAAAAVGTVAGSGVGMSRGAVSLDGPAVATVDSGGAPLKRSNTVGLPSGALAMVEVEVPGGTTSDTASDATGLPGGATAGEVSRQTPGGLVVDIMAVEGPGGIGTTVAPNAGLNSRRALRESPQVSQNATNRYSRTNPGGTPNTSTTAIVPADAFSGRTGQFGPQTEASVELGLVYVQRQQMSDGRWSLARVADGQPLRGEQAALASDTAATGLALMAFQGAGYHHQEFQYADTVRKGIEWLVRNQKEDGDLYTVADNLSNRSVWLYSHSIAALALCEAYGMTQDPELRDPAQRAIDFIVESQNKDRGGWRYSPSRSSDTSVTGWMFMALHSGELANLEVPKDTYDRIDKWLDLAQQSRTDKHLYRYNPYAADTEEQRHGRTASKTMTSVGLLMRLYSGWKRDNPDMQKGADYLQRHLPEMGNDRSVATTERDTYYWYYATQVMCHMGGEYWTAWNAKMHPMLLQSQTKTGALAGSWDPMYPVPDRWGPHGGRLYVTTMNLLSLEVRHRLLPLYIDTVGKKQ